MVLVGDVLDALDVIASELTHAVRLALCRINQYIVRKVTYGPGYLTNDNSCGHTVERFAQAKSLAVQLQDLGALDETLQGHTTSDGAAGNLRHSRSKSRHYL